jgi:hypothetical protein
LETADYSQHKLRSSTATAAHCCCHRTGKYETVKKLLELSPYIIIAYYPVEFFESFDEVCTVRN